jgi:hypothetical protein
MAIGRKLMWAVVGGVTSKVVRSATRRAMHNDVGNPRLPQPVRRRRGMGTALTWVVGASALMAIADTLSEQGRNAARAR